MDNDTQPRKLDIEHERRGWLFSLTVIAGLSAFAGGFEMISHPAGNPQGPPAHLHGTPFGTFLVPGIVLLIVGAISMLSAVLLVRRARWAVDVTIFAGGTLSLWTLSEAAVVESFHALHGAYLGLGLAIVAIAVRGTQRTRSPRHRWFVLVTAAEGAGFLAPIAAGVLLYRAHASAVVLSLGVIASGLLEGICLGTGQAHALPVRVARRRFALLTGLAATGAWSIAMGAMWLSSGELSALVAIPLTVLAAALGLGAIGAAQWIELRKHGHRAHRWIGWTALAWVVALPLSLVPGIAIDEQTPLASQFVLWACGGCAMAYVMAAVTWQGVRQLWPSMASVIERHERSSMPIVPAAVEPGPAHVQRSS